MIIGFVATIISMFGWGSYFVPVKKIGKYNSFYFQFLMCISIFLSSVIISFLYDSFVFSYLGILSGILWSIGNISSALAVKKSGLSKSAPVWMGIGVFISFLWGILFFKESLNYLTIGVIGIILLISGIILISSIINGNKKYNIKGIVLAIIAGLIFGSYLVLLKISALEPIKFLFSMSLGILIGGFIIYFIKRPKIKKKVIIPGLFSGVIWNIANFASLFVVLNLGIAIGFPLTQTALFISILWGVIYFKEIKEKEKINRLIFSAIILFMGAILMGFSL